MSYFDNFRKVLYGSKEAIDIIESIQLKYKPIIGTIEFYKIRLIDGEKPHNLSYRLYDTTEYHYLLMMINNVVDPYYDWLLSSQELDSYIDDKYGSKRNDIHHFINLDTDRKVDDFDHKKYQNMIDDGIELPLFISPVTNYAFENNENEKKREIVVISPQDISKVHSDFLHNIGNLKRV